MSAAPQTIELRASREIPRRLVIHQAASGDVRVKVYPWSRKIVARMLAYGIGTPRISRCEFTKEFTLWAGPAAFDVTEAEAKQLAEALGLEIQS